MTVILRSVLLAFAAGLVISVPVESSPPSAKGESQRGFPASAIAHAERQRSSLRDPSGSSRSLPVRIRPSSDAELGSFRRLAARFRTDSTRHFEIRDGRLEISYDLLQDIAGAGMPDSAGSGPRKRRLEERLAAFLSKSHGMRFSPSGNGFGVYLPNDKLLLDSPQWALNNTGVAIAARPGKAGSDIGIRKVWDKFGGNDTLVVAVVDAGFDFRHPELKGRNWVNLKEAKGIPGVDDDSNGYVDDSVGWDFVENDNDPQDVHGHGTNISSVIGAAFDNKEGIAGVLAECRIMPVRVLDASGHGDQGSISKAILYAVDNGAKVINFSIGGDVDNPLMRSAFETARDRGVPIVVAAGNDGLDIDVARAYPASYNYENMLVVAAHDHGGLLCDFSNYGKTAAHLAAPGEHILVCGLPTPKITWLQDFEAAGLDAWNVSAGGFALSTAEPIAGKQSLVWIARNNDTAVTTEYIDLTGIKGGALNFRLDFKQAHASDVVIVEANKMNSAFWREIAVVGSAQKPEWFQTYGMQDFDGSKFRLRFRTSLSSRFSSATRQLKIDDVAILVPDTGRPEEPVYTLSAGTSLAAPHVTAYVGLHRLACDRKGIPWTRAMALKGVSPEPALAGKVASNGRLDAYKGLEFYLSTLPDFRVVDSTVLAWKGGERVEYSLKLDPAPPEAYRFAESGLPEEASIDGAGMLTWATDADQVGSYSVRLTAAGPTVLRKEFAFSIEASQTVAVGPGSPAAVADRGILRWAGAEFLLPPAAAAGRHLVEVFGTDASGKTRILDRVWMSGADFVHAGGTYQRPGTGSAVVLHVRVRFDGRFLVPVK